MKPYGLFKIIFKFISFKLRAVNIHKVHSPFLFSLISRGLKLNDKRQFADIEILRKELKSDQRLLQFNDLGHHGVVKRRKISEIAKRSLKPRKYAEIISSLALQNSSRSAIELGTSFGITTAYLARSVSSEVYTFEGAESILETARHNWSRLQINNIRSYLGDFNDTILNTLSLPQDVDLIFIDGHHQIEPTLAYFKRLKQCANNETVFVFDDIHWSADMEKAWSQIQNDEDVRLSVDLFFIGLVFMRKELTKQHFEINL